MTTTGEATYKFAVVLKKGLEPGVALNAASHMTACLVARANQRDRAQMEFVEYKDADGNSHPVSALSLIVLSAKNANQIRTARLAAAEVEILAVDFTESMTGGTYVEQMDRTSKLSDEQIDYWGLCLFGPKETLDPITKKFSIWR